MCDITISDSAKERAYHDTWSTVMEFDTRCGKACRKIFHGKSWIQQILEWAPAYEKIIKPGQSGWSWDDEALVHDFIDSMEHLVYIVRYDVREPVPIPAVYPCWSINATFECGVLSAKEIVRILLGAGDRSPSDAGETGSTFLDAAALEMLFDLYMRPINFKLD